MFFRSLLVINCLLLTYINANNDVWSYHLWLDPYKKFSLKWNIDDRDEFITGLLEVKTRGWVGFGLSPNGGMKGADIMMAWVDDNDGKTYFQDRHATDETMPTVDESQDWLLLDSSQNATHTIIKFTRPYTSCDKEFDVQITRDTARVIYAYHDEDPKSVDSMKIHGRYERGTKSILLLSQTEMIGLKPKEEDLRNFTLTVKNITIPPKDTTYWCKLFKLPNKKIHVVKFESVISTGSEPFAHHISLSACTHPNYDVLKTHIESDGCDCSEYKNMPKDFKHCTTPYFLWAVGGLPLTLPEDIGFPLGDEDSNTHLLLTVHYDNPYLVEGKVDSSGFRFYYTENYRKHEAFTMTVGSAVDTRMFIPPNVKQFTYSSHCHPDCYRNAIPDDGLKIFAVRSHAHLTARQLKTRVFRGNKELPWIEDDQHYDFNLQTFRTMKPYYTLHRGDQMTVECVFDTTDRNKTTFGGPGSREEMCLSILFYYPRMIGSKVCFSGLSIEGQMEMAGVNEVVSKSETDHIIRSPKPLQNMSLFEYVTEKQDWGQWDQKNSYELMLKHKQKPQCYWTKTEADTEMEGMIGYPEVEEVYKPPVKACKSIASKSVESVQIEKTNPNYILYIFIAIIIVNVLLINIVMIYVFRKKFIIQFKQFA